MSDGMRDVLDVPGGRLYFEVDGPRQGPALTLIHAGVAHLRMWDEQLPVFTAAGYRVIRYDTRGFGRTESDDVPFSNRADIVALLDHLGVARTAIGGLSRGGTIALDFALEHPERVSALIIGATSPGGFEFAEPELDPIWEESDRLAAQHAWDAIVELEVKLWTDGHGQSAERVAPNVRERMIRWGRENYPNHGEGQAQRLDPPAVGRLAEVHLPTLVIWGDLDVGGVLAGSEAMAAGIDGARTQVFAGAAHMINLEQPDLFERVVLDFLAGARAGT